MIKLIQLILGVNVLRAFVLIGLITYILGVTFTIYEIIKGMWFVFNQATYSLSSALNGFSSSSAMSCFYYFVDALGVTTVINSFLVSLFGLATMYGSVVVYALSLKFYIFMKNYYLSIVG